jgi:hypothetical protein
MEGNSDLGKEDFEILTTQVLLSRIPHFLQDVAASFTWLSIDSGEGQVVVPRFEVVAFLL